MRRLIIQTSAETLGNIHGGKFRFINRLSAVLTQQNWAVSYREKRRGDAISDRLDRAYHLHEITGARGARGLNFRRAYFYPWWMFDHPHQRYGGRIGALTYEAAQIDASAARAFYDDLQRHYLADWARGNPDGPALVPLQAELTRKRAWQFSNLEGIVAQIRTHDPGRQIVLKPHPKLIYSGPEKALLAQLAMQDHVHVVEGPMSEMLGGAAYVATHNSATAFEAMVLGIPSILFALADFHHICPVVQTRSDAASAFARLHGPKPDFARYLYWFLEQNCLHAGRDDAYARIATQLAECGWPVAPITGPMT